MIGIKNQFELRSLSNKSMMAYLWKTIQPHLAFCIYNKNYEPIRFAKNDQR
jgi:hypothetical protein